VVRRTDSKIHTGQKEEQAKGVAGRGARQTNLGHKVSMARLVSSRTHGCRLTPWVCAALFALDLAVGGQARAQATPTLDARIAEQEYLGRGHPTEAATLLDRLRAETAEFSSQRLELLTVQGLMLAQSSQPEGAEHAAAQLEAWGRNHSSPAASAAALLVRARALARSGNLPRAEALMRDAMALLPPDRPARDRFRYVFAQGYIADQSGKLEDAVRLNHEALTLADRTGDPWRRAEARNALAYAYREALQLERAHALSLEAIAIAQTAGDDVSLAHAYNTAGIVLDSLGDLQGQRRSFERAIEHARRGGSKLDESLYLANLADFFLKNGDYKTALAHAERALPLAREVKELNGETVALMNIGLAHISMQHFELGKRHVQEAIAIDERRGSLTGVADSYNELGTYLEKAGDLPGALAALHRHRALAAGILQRDQQKAIFTMQEQYDADRRARELVLLTREGEIAAEQLHRRDLQQRLWWLLALVFVLSFATVGLLYRRVRRTNRLLSSTNDLLKVQSERDPLTGLANRRHFQAAMRQLATDGKLAGTVCLIDIDHFKRINDRYGHGVGDAVLVEVAKRLRAALRDEDMIVRWGGEEFLVVVQAQPADQVEALAQRMLAAIGDTPVAHQGHHIPVTASIGFATFPIGPLPLQVSWEHAIDLVDTAMYLAKAHGRNRAYGVRLLQARDEATLERITNGLEAAWRESEVALTLLQGQPVAEAAA
jgi:diguanylate cyclase (GGDEF)-like protein